MVSSSSSLPSGARVAFHRFVALRYLLGALGREEGRRFLRFITFVAVGGVAIGVGALLLALAIVRGFSNEIEAKIIGFGAHVQVESMRHAPLSDANEMLLGIRGLEGVSHVAPVIAEFALLRQAEARIDGVSLWGTDSLPSYVEKTIMAGSARLEIDETGNLGAVVGAALARQMDIGIGERITVFSTRNVELGGAARPRVKQFVVTGIYETSLADFDATYVFADLEAARQLFDYGQDEVTRLDVTLKDIAESDNSVAARRGDLWLPRHGTDHLRDLPRAFCVGEVTGGHHPDRDRHHGTRCGVQHRRDPAYDHTRENA